MKKILVPTWDTFNYGERASIIGTIDPLKTLAPDVDLTILSPFPEVDREVYEKYGLQIRNMPWFRMSKSKGASLKRTAIVYSGVLCLFSLLNCICHRIFKSLKIDIPIRGGLQKYDMYLDNSGPAHCLDRHHNSRAGFYYSFFPLLLCMIIKMPFVIYADSMGPYNNRVDRFLVRFFCNRASLITVRDESSMNHLQRLGLNNPNVHLTSDPAFLFVSQCSKRKAYEILATEGVGKVERPLVGISPNGQIHKFAFSNIKSSKERYENYVVLMAKVTDYLVEKLDATVILIPHDLLPGLSDAPVCEAIYHKVINKHKIKVISGRYTVDELKGIIGTCQMFIGCRLHSNIDSMSMSIPTFAVSYGTKYGVLSPLLGEMEEMCTVDITKPNADELVSELYQKVDYIWENRIQITRTFKENMPTVVEKAMLNAELVKELIDS